MKKITFTQESLWRIYIMANMGWKNIEKDINSKPFEEIGKPEKLKGEISDY